MAPTEDCGRLPHQIMPITQVQRALQSAAGSSRIADLTMCGRVAAASLAEGMRPQIRN
jgi:hypothetical protein